LILLIGGTSETKPIALALAEKGFKVLASTATDNELDVGVHTLITRRSGRMNLDEMCALIKKDGIRLVMDASHPYAAVVHETSAKSAKITGVPYLRYERPGVGGDEGAIAWADDHEAGAVSAFSFDVPVLLTTGSRNLLPYVRQARERNVPIVARVLPHAESEEACKKAGLVPNEVISARGPFTVEENLAVIKERKIGVLVTKDSGAAGGVAEKMEAARLAGCKVVMVGRPESGAHEKFTTIESFVSSASEILSR
jgi:precorrin-6A/cobalt-precorrin-6A reductase